MSDATYGRLLVLEAVAMVALAGAIRPVNDLQPTEQLKRILDGVKIAAMIRIQHEHYENALSDAGKRAATAYLDDVLSMFSETLLPRAPEPV